MTLPTDEQLLRLISTMIPDTETEEEKEASIQEILTEIKRGDSDTIAFLKSVKTIWNMATDHAINAADYKITAGIVTVPEESMKALKYEI